MLLTFQFTWNLTQEFLNITELANCLEAIQVWICLVINKFEIPCSHNSLLVSLAISVESVKSLFVTPDEDNSMQRHMANLSHVCYYHLHEL